MAHPLAAQVPALHRIQTGDLDKKCDPCTDFAQYANGNWHAQNPVPAYMDRWSRRWKAGEEAKDQLKVILDDVSSRMDWPKGSVEQLIGDYYGSCMDEARINRLDWRRRSRCSWSVRRVAVKRLVDYDGSIVEAVTRSTFRAYLSAVPHGLSAGASRSVAESSQCT